MNKTQYKFMIDILNEYFDKNKHLSYGQIAYLLNTISYGIFNKQQTLEQMEKRKDVHKEESQ